VSERARSNADASTRHVDLSNTVVERAAINRNPRESNGVELSGGAIIVRCFSCSHMVQQYSSAAGAAAMMQCAACS